MDIKNYVRRHETLGRPSAGRGIHIAFGVNRTYVPPMGILMTSLVKNNPAARFSFHVFLDEIDQTDLERLDQFNRRHPQARIDLYYVEPDAFNDIYFGDEYPTAIFYRIVAADYLAVETDRLIYLDSDMLCLRPANELFELDLEGKLLAAVADFGKWIPLHKAELGLDEGYRYFNTGLLCLNLRRWHELEISRQLFDVLSKYKLESFPDQDALNLVVCNGRYEIEYVSNRFNHFFRANGQEMPIGEDTVLEHFAGRLKPWQPWCESETKKIYGRYQEESLWKDFRYLPQNYQENRLMGRHCRREGKWLEALEWYRRYLSDRFKEKGFAR